MDMDPAERGGVEWVSEFCPVKGSSLRTTCVLHCSTRYTPGDVPINTAPRGRRNDAILEIVRQLMIWGKGEGRRRGVGSGWVGTE